MNDGRNIGGLIKWAPVDGKGRGVAAVRDVEPGQLLECSPVLVFPVEDLDATHGREPVIGDYVWWWEEKGEGKEMAFPFGYISLYNHSPSPNARFEFDYEAKTMSIYADKAIKAGEEITVDYGIEPWFEMKD